MSNTRKSAKSLNVATIQTVDQDGAVVADAMAEIAAEEHFFTRVRSNLPVVKLGSFTLDLGKSGNLLMEVLKPWPQFGTSFTFGPLAGAHKWHIEDHFQIMGVLNAVGSLRLGHYTLVEEGLHLKQTFETIRANKIYEGTFGYVKFETAPAEWLREFEKRNLMPKDSTHEDQWHKFVIKNQKVTWGHWVNPSILGDVADKLGKKVEELSPVTLANYREEWNTLHKRIGLEAALRAARGETHIIATLRTIKGKEWQIKVENTRAGLVYSQLPSWKADLAKAMGDAAAAANAQLDADQDNFATKDVPVNVVEEKALQIGKLVCYQGEQFDAQQLVGANVAKVRGDMVIVPSLFLRDLKMVLRQYEVATEEGMTFKVNRFRA